MERDLDQLSVATIRTLAMDAVQRARSGHPGTPMALAPVAYVLWQRFLRYDPGDPIWPNRDRFVLSNGHASMLLYALLHLSGVKAVDPDYETLGRDRYVGSGGAVVGMHTFGASAPLKALQTRFGFTPDAIVSTASALLARGEG